MYTKCMVPGDEVFLARKASIPSKATILGSVSPGLGTTSLSSVDPVRACFVSSLQH